MTDSFWEDPSLVRRFATRDPDHRLVKLIAEFHDPASVRVLDLGCAAGRNTVLLAQRGFDVVAVDASAAMVAETRKRVARAVGAAAARRRVQQASMDNLKQFPTRTSTWSLRWVSTIRHLVARRGTRRWPRRRA